jgi:hypothetical protein
MKVEKRNKTSRARQNRVVMAQQMIEIYEQGSSYNAPSGRRVGIREDLEKTIKGSIHYHYKQSVATPPYRDVYETAITVENASSIHVALSLAGDVSLMLLSVY